ncbi:MAG: decarboxylating NADP(+)-dependent phosphogluconate dehydrogenase [Calditrichaceae bacterium]|jgi:6-phosphogluconate dehydrogenase
MSDNIGIIGLGVMGQNLALNIERNGYSLCAYDLDPRKQKDAREKFNGKNINTVSNLKDFVDNLESPKKIMMMVPAGSPVDAVISDLKAFLNNGDVLIDGGNSYFLNTTERKKNLRRGGIYFIGTGISGGEQGALWGPSIMPGGDPDGWPLVKDFLQSIAAKAEDGEPCCKWVGNDGAGHFVKMIHNGIEYGDMQMISEAYFLLEQLMGLDPIEMADIFDEWNKGELNSYLIEITSKILRKIDNETGKPMIHMILDTVGQKGTGKWSSQAALDLGVPALTIAKSVFARIASSYKEERVAASKVLEGPKPHFSTADKAGFIENIRKALFASKICSYAQGFQLMKRASEVYNWDLNYANIASIWRNGCIIRAQFLNKMKEAFEAQPDLNNLLLYPYFSDAIHDSQVAWRQIISICIENGLPVPGFNSAISYYDSYRAELLPARLVQAQRDFFGAHTYERVDKPRGQFFHTEWE